MDTITYLGDWKPRVERLINRAEKEDIELVEQALESCNRYVRSVVNMENAIGVARFRMEASEYRAYIQQLDYSRKINHNATIVNVKLLNRLCDLYGVEPVYEGDVDNRKEVAAFAFRVVQDYFEGRR